MKIKNLLCLCMTVLSLALALVMLSSCNEDPSLEERGYTVEVVYDFNGGIVDSTAKRVLYYKENQPILKPGTSVELKEPSLDSLHTVAGWYRALLNEDGTPKKDADGNIMTEETPYDFTGARATESMTLVVKWKEVPTITIMVEGREPDVRPYEAGDVVNRFSYMEDRKDESGKKTHTFLDYYTDEACSEENRAVWPITMSESTHITLYTRWLEGDVLVVRSRTDLNKLSSYRNGTVYLDADIDYSDSRTSFSVLNDFSGHFMGNGHTISHVTLDKLTLGKGSENFGLFGTLKSSAVIEDLTLDSVVMRVKIAWSAHFTLGVLSGNAEAGATVRNCTFRDCSITYQRQSSSADATVSYSVGEAYEGVLGSVSGSVTYQGTGNPTVEEDIS